MATGDLDLLNRLQGCYVTLPTMFRDDAELSVDLNAMRRHVRFLIDGGITTEHRGAARRRCGRRLLDHDLRRKGSRHRGGGRARPPGGFRW